MLDTVFHGSRRRLRLDGMWMGSNPSFDDGDDDAHHADAVLGRTGCAGDGDRGVAVGNASSDVSGNVGNNVTGIYGDLHVDANGSYTYRLTSPYTTAAGRRRQLQHGAGA